MRRFLFYIFSLIILITCRKDVFEEETVTGGDPDSTFNTGDTINYNVDATGHPFYLKTEAGTGTGNTISGLTNNGTTNQTISWTPSSTGTYYYQCSLHEGMVGTITIQ